MFPARVGNPELQTVLRRCFCRRRRVRQPGFCCRRERAVARGGEGQTSATCAVCPSRLSGRQFSERWPDLEGRGTDCASRVCPSRLGGLPTPWSGGTSPGFEGARELGALYARQRDAAAATRVANSVGGPKSPTQVGNPELQTGTLSSGNQSCHFGSAVQSRRRGSAIQNCRQHFEQSRTADRHFVCAVWRPSRSAGGVRRLAKGTTSPSTTTKRRSALSRPPTPSRPNVTVGGVGQRGRARGDPPREKGV